MVASGQAIVNYNSQPCNRINISTTDSRRRVLGYSMIAAYVADFHHCQWPRSLFLWFFCKGGILDLDNVLLTLACRCFATQSCIISEYAQEGIRKRGYIIFKRSFGRIIQGIRKGMTEEFRLSHSDAISTIYSDFLNDFICIIWLRLCLWVMKDMAIQSSFT